MASTSVLRRCVGVRTLLRARSMSSNLTRAARTARSPACAVRRGVHTVVGSQSPAGSLPLDHDGAALTLIRYPICPFCRTTQAYLDYHAIPFRPIDINPVTKAELKTHPAIQAATARGGSYKTVPVAVLPSTDPIQGSLEIINHLEAIGAATTPRSAGADESIAWAYDKFVRLFPINIYRSPLEAWEVFSYITSTDMPFVDRVKVRVGGSAIMYAVAKLKTKKALGVTDERAALYAAGYEWLRRCGVPDTGAPASPAVRFHGGDAPDMADIVVFGMLSAMSGMRTLADLRTNVPALDKWYTGVLETMSDAAVRPTK